MPSTTAAHLLAGVKDESLRTALDEPSRRPLTLWQKGLSAVGVAAVCAYPFVFDAPFYHHVMILIFLNALMAQSWNIMAGYCGQISLGHAVFFGIGAYSSAFLFTSFQVSPWLGMLVGIVIAMAMALIIGIPTFRLRGHYFAIATLVIAESVQTFVQRWDYVGAATGIMLPIVREDALVNFQFNQSKIPYYFIALAFLALVCAAVWLLERSKAGYYFRAIRDEPDAASSLGVNITLYKSLAFMLSAAFMSIAGTFYAQYILVVDPEPVFALTLSIQVLLMAVMGGVGTISGPIIGAAVLIVLSESTRVYLGGTGGAVDLIIYGALIVLICVFQPEGLVGIARQLMALARRWLSQASSSGGMRHGDA